MSALLSVSVVSKRYGALQVTRDLSFELQPGEALGVLGPNGAGKTTLFNLISGDVRADSGTVHFMGVDITRQAPHQRCRAGIGRSYQIAQPFGGMTVFENLLVASLHGQPGQAQAEAESHCVQILQATGLLAKSNQRASGLTLLDRKRLELARALATRPQLLLLDEIAGGLTEHEAHALVELVQQIRAEGVALIWIEHVVHALLAVATRLLVINFGEKLADGEPREVMASADVQRVYMGIEICMSTPLLQAYRLEARYGDFQALFGIDFRVEVGQVTAIIGANGAGKSTFLKALAGQIAVAPEAVQLDGKPIGGLSAHRIVKLGIALVPEGRRLFPSLTVEENLRIGATARRSGPWTLARVYELFPALVDKRHAPGASLSGGQQQMVAIGRALMSNPRLLLCDEVSLGLSPLVIRDIYQRLPQVCAEGTAVVIVEQDIDMAMRAASQVYCFMHGRVSLQGPADGVSKAQVSAAYFGVDAPPKAATAPDATPKEAA